MIIDLICDRRENETAFGEDLYSTLDFYNACMRYGRIADDITAAMDYGTETDVKKALCKYIDENEYNPAIKNYITQKTWLD